MKVRIKQDLMPELNMKSFVDRLHEVMMGKIDATIREVLETHGYNEEMLRNGRIAGIQVMEAGADCAGYAAPFVSLFFDDTEGYSDKPFCGIWFGGLRPQEHIQRSGVLNVEMDWRPLTEAECDGYSRGEIEGIARDIQVVYKVDDSQDEEEYFTDEVGGRHGCGVGWNPQKVFCGECVEQTCAGCKNEKAGGEHEKK